MPDKRLHRGPHPDDVNLFARDKIALLARAVEDYSLLLTKGYAEKSALKLVGDRFALTQRQRLAVMRSSCSDMQLESRNNRRINPEGLAGRIVAVDGYNVLITIEAAMSDGVIFKGRDECMRDLASIHGTYRKVHETMPAVQIIGDFLAQLGVVKVLWLLDSPVSNSGRLKSLIAKLVANNNWSWEIKLSLNPDAELIKADTIVATSDSIILDKCKNWINLAAEIITRKIPAANIINLADLEKTREHRT
jgi:hypothetical protein